MHWNGLKSDLKQLLKHKFRRGAICQKQNPQINKNFKNGQKQAFKFDSYCKNAKHTFHQQIYHKLRNRRGGYVVVVNYQSLVSNFFPLAASPPIYFSP